ncbi:MAG: thioesterase [Spirochaetales bacterium]|nr:thioesterase [Spirochaetales bacterium]
MRTDITIVLFSYAGSTSSFFHRWKSFFPENFNLLPVELAGRGKRIDEPFYTDFDQAVRDLSLKINPHVSSGSFALYGHSLGSWMAYECALYLEKRFRKNPMHLFLSGRMPPHKAGDEKRYSGVSDEEFIEDLKAIGGTPEEIIKSEDFRNFFFPIIKSDYLLLETYAEKDIEPIDTDISFLFADGDKSLDRDAVREWGRYTSCNMTVHDFEGDHFFIHQKVPEIARLMIETLSEKQITF